VSDRLLSLLDARDEGIADERRGLRASALDAGRAHSEACPNAKEVFRLA
jgi:hypothetical protein